MAAKTKLELFQDFRPSFIAVGVGGFNDLAEHAYEVGKGQLKTIINDATPDFKTEGVVDASSMGLAFAIGHFPSKSDSGIPKSLSNLCPFRLTVHYEAAILKEIRLTVFLLNARFIMAEQMFKPAKVDGSAKFTPLATASEPCGLLLLTDPDGDADLRYQNLTKDLPASPAPSNFADYNKVNLLCRLDLSLKWTAVDDSTKYQMDLFKRIIGIPDLVAPPGTTFTALRLFSPKQKDTFDGLLFFEDRFGIRVPQGDGKGNKGIGASFILKAPEKPADSSTPEEKKPWDAYRAAVTEFDLTQDFKGLLFQGVEVHWLSDDGFGHPSDAKIGLGLSAYAFSGHAQGTNAQWFTSAEVDYTPKGQGFLSSLTSVKLRATLDAAERRSVVLTGKFRDDLNYPFEWLKGRAVTVSSRFQKGKDAKGAELEVPILSLAIEGTGDHIFARFTPKGAQNGIAVALALGPVVAGSGLLDISGKALPPGVDARDYFINIAGPDRMAQIYGAAALGWFLQKNITVREIRIVGTGVQLQPRSINVLDAPGTEAALLFDYEADFRIEVNSELKTTRDVTARVNGSGLTFGERPTDGTLSPVRWVQVPSGVRDLAIADPGLWELGTLGKILKIAEITLRRNPRRELLIRLRLSGNLGIVTAGDFVFAIDIQDKGGVKLESYPSDLSFEIPKAVKARGTLFIDTQPKAPKKVRGSVDVTLIPTGLRVFAATLVDSVDSAGGRATALAASARVEFPTPIPLAASGLSLRGLDALYASHYQRLEAAAPAGVPPALQWLKEVNGEVAESIRDHPEKWKVAYDQYAFGIGVLLTLQATAKLFNLNAMLVVEKPGPKILIFAKANLLKEPKDNKSQGADLTKGVLGLLEIDVPNNRITLGAWIDAKFDNLFSFTAPIELYLTIAQLSAWHLYIGHFNNKATGKLDIAGIVNVTASCYIMAAGDVIEGAPVKGGTRTLPGFAVAVGVGAAVRIGISVLYLRVSFDFYLAISMGSGLYASGTAVLIGELFLFIVSISASGELTTEFLRSPNGHTDVHIDGKVCGKISLIFFELSGCVGLSIGNTISDPTKFPDLVSSFSLVSGTNVALYGQGCLGPVDGVLGNSADGKPPERIPLDAVITISLIAAPRLSKSPSGFAAKVIPARDEDTQFRMGAKQGFFELTSVRLMRIEKGVTKEINYSGIPATWWINAQSPAGGQAIPRELALFARNPLGTKNAMASEDSLRRWLASLKGKVCKDPVPGQSCIYFFGAGDLGKGQGGKWTLSGLYCSMNIAQEIGRVRPIVTRVELENQPGPVVQLGVPPIVGACVAGRDPASGAPVPMLRMLSFRFRDIAGRMVPVRSVAHILADIAPASTIELLLAHQLRDRLGDALLKINFSKGSSVIIQFNQTGKITLEPLTAAAVRTFHRDCDFWKPQSEAFSRLAQTPEFRDATFVRAELSLPSSTQKDDYPVEIIISLANPEGMSSLSETCLYIGAIKYVPLEEMKRFDRDKNYQASLKTEVEQYLNEALTPIPLLESNSEYQLAVGWQSNGDGAGPKNSEFKFKTTDQPPVSARPYLLTVFPQAAERFHFSSDKPGFALASRDLFRILSKFPCHLQVKITDEANRPVLGAKDTIRWDQGVVLNPNDFTDSSKADPKGFVRKTFSTLSSALQEAIRRELGCLNIKSADEGIWVGFDVDLLQSASYSIEIDLIRDDAKANETTVSSLSLGDEHFLAWRFHTGLHSDLSAHVNTLKQRVRRNRLVAQTPTFADGTRADPELPGVTLVSDKDFEDTLHLAMGERSDRSGESAVTVLWNKEGQFVVAHSLLVESREPLLRRTATVDLAPKRSGGGDNVLTVEKVDRILHALELKDAASTGVKSIFISSGGFRALAVFTNPLAAGDVILSFKQRHVDRIPVAEATSELRIPMSELAPRQLR